MVEPAENCFQEDSPDAAVTSAGVNNDALMDGKWGEGI